MTRVRLKLGAALAFAATACIAIVGPCAAEPDAVHLTTTASGGLVRNLQMGVGKSVVVDLPEEAAEMYVGDPRIANAIVRSATRIYVSAIADRADVDLRPGTGRPKDRDRRRSRSGVTWENVSNLSLTPRSRATMSTSAPSRIRSSSPDRCVVGRRRRQKAIDIASGFLGVSSVAGGDAKGGLLPRLAAHSVMNGKLINSLTHPRAGGSGGSAVTVAEFVTRSSSNSGHHERQRFNGSLKLDNPFAIDGALSATEATLNGVRTQRHLSGLRAPGRRSYARRADGDRGVGREREIHGRRHHSPSSIVCSAIPLVSTDSVRRPMV